MPYITLNDQYTKPFVEQSKIEEIVKKVQHAHHTLHERTGLGNGFLGWLDYPKGYDQHEVERIKKVAKKIKKQSDIFVIIGVGGSYLGARAAIELLNHTYMNELRKDQKDDPLVVFAGHHLSGTYMKDLLDLLEGRDFSINVISKSGSTLETAIAFRILKNYMTNRYSVKESKERIFITTGTAGPLRNIAEEEGYTTFTIPPDIGGRYSVLTAVGLLPMAVSGIPIDAILQGAEQALEETAQDSLEKNPSYHYAALRYLLYQDGKKIELLNTFEPRWRYFQEWWKQLFGESEGKDGKGVYPAAANFTTDLHSLGQYIQDGERHLFQTFLFAEEIDRDVSIPYEEKDFDQLNELHSYRLHTLNKHAFEGSLLAHTSGDVPNIVLTVPKIDAFTFGYLVYFFQKACAISGYLLGVNPFDQPGVETYKQHMKRLIQQKKN